MEQFEAIFVQLDQLGEKSPQLVKVCAENNIRRGHVLAAAGLVVSIVMIFLYGYALICTILTSIYPMLQSVDALQHGSDRTKQIWLSFWCVFGIFQTVELFIGFVLNFIPYYSIIRLLFFVFLMHPTTNGSEIVYTRVFSPFLKEHQKEIEQFIADFSSKASEVGADVVN